MSEFGRAVAENGNRGTDHGHGNAMMIIGGQNVRGGKVYGRWPGLAREQRYDGRDLAVTTDFRSVFAESRARPSGRDRQPDDLSRLRSARSVSGFWGRLESDVPPGSDRFDDHYRPPDAMRSWSSPRGSQRNLDRMQSAATAAGCGCGRTPRRTSRRRSRAADRARRGRHLLREARRSGGLRGRGDRPTSGCPIRSIPSTPIACSRSRDRIALSFIIDDPAVARAWSAHAAARRIARSTS